jgi:hypothetical protein
MKLHLVSPDTLYLYVEQDNGRSIVVFDVSAIHPLHRSVPFAVAYADLYGAPGRQHRGSHMTPRIHPSISAAPRSASSRGGPAKVASDPLPSACLIHAAME